MAGGCGFVTCMVACETELVEGGTVDSVFTCAF